MKYENAKDIFPEDLLRQIQRYVSGKLIYIPSLEEKKSWGEASGYRRYLVERNRAIRAEKDINAVPRFLSLDTIFPIFPLGKEPNRIFGAGELFPVKMHRNIPG